MVQFPLNLDIPRETIAIRGGPTSLLSKPIDANANALFHRRRLFRKRGTLNNSWRTGGVAMGGRTVVPWWQQSPLVSPTNSNALQCGHCRPPILEGWRKPTLDAGSLSTCSLNAKTWGWIGSTWRSLRRLVVWAALLIAFWISLWEMAKFRVADLVLRPATK